MTTTPCSRALTLGVSATAQASSPNARAAERSSIELRVLASAVMGHPSWQRKLLAWIRTPGFSASAYSATLLTVIGIADLATTNIAGGLAFLAFALFVWELRRCGINRMRRSQPALDRADEVAAGSERPVRLPVVRGNVAVAAILAIVAVLWTLARGDYIGLVIVGVGLLAGVRFYLSRLRRL